jgi:hypothetical protein
VGSFGRKLLIKSKACNSLRQVVWKERVMAILIPQENCTAWPLASTVLRFEDRWIAQSLNLTNFYFVSAVGEPSVQPEKYI